MATHKDQISVSCPGFGGLLPSGSVRAFQVLAVQCWSLNKVRPAYHRAVVVCCH